MTSFRFAPVLVLAALGIACASSSATSAQDSGVDASTGSDGQSGTCPLAANTTPTTTVTGGCALLTRDTSACMSARTTQGLSGAWLKFSCRVTLTKFGTASTPYVQASSDDQPDHTSNYFPSTNACYEAYTPAFPDPNQISTQALVVKAPTTPGTTNTKMGLGPIGIAVNGVAIFDNQAAPGDDIFTEAGSFDRCGGHPAPGGAYHYHGEPYSISYDDSNLIGVLKDGYFVYGRRDGDGSTPSLDANGGHTGTTPDSPTAVYHYHLNQQTSTSAGTTGQKQWFLTTGTYEGTPLL